jgi:hypothetical protein
MKLFHKLIFSLIIFGAAACGKESALKKETLDFQPESKGWITNDTIRSHFVVVDDNGISSSFTMQQNSHYFITSTSSILGITTNLTTREYHFQGYGSTYGIPFSLSLSAGFKPFGDELYIDLARVGFAYDLKFETITRVNTDFGNKSKNMSNNAYEPGDGMLSTVEILSSFSTSYHDYETVLYFQLLDFEDKWDDFTVVKIYVAKGIGLVKYELNNGLSFERL